MKPLLTTLAILTGLAVSAFAGSSWTHQAEEAEDATSIHYYFYESNGESIQRVRWVWNGGAQNLPAVTDYYLESGQIRICHLVGRREDVAKLVLGHDAELQPKLEYSIAAKSTAVMLAPAPPARELSRTQRIDLCNLIGLLARERHSYKSGAPDGRASNP